LYFIQASTSVIGHWVFAGCVGLTGVVLQCSDTNVESFAFDGCNGLEVIGDLLTRSADKKQKAASGSSIDANRARRSNGT
jgi:hypothetical protein